MFQRLLVALWTHAAYLTSPVGASNNPHQGHQAILTDSDSDKVDLKTPCADNTAPDS